MVNDGDMTLPEFNANVRSSGRYRTAEQAARRQGPLLRRSDIWFYVRLNAVFIAHSRWAYRGMYDNRRWAFSSFRILQLCEAAGGRFEIEGLDHLGALAGPAVIVANHMSLAETVLLPCLLLPFGGASFVVKQNLLAYPCFGRILRSVEPVGVTRRNAREDLRTVFEQGGARLAAGRSVVIFPQATRNATFDPTAFNSLGVKLAARAGVPVVPLALKTDFMGIGRWIKDFGPMNRSSVLHFSFGAPLKVDGNEKAVHKQVVDFITDRLLSWQGLVRPVAEGRSRT